ncbi:MAG: HAMP domain-containing histidine kinase [Clostridiales bacterium]|nr:HAMP domain-containing histidine kinase [Clostridiales bacterium]
MDIKSKSSRIIGSIILTFVVIITAGAVVTTYDHFWDVVDNKKENPYEEYWFNDYLNRNAYSLYMAVAEERAGKELKPSDIYLNIEKKEILEEKEDSEQSETTVINDQDYVDYTYDDPYSIENMVREFDDLLNGINGDTVSANQNLKYQVVDNKTGKVVTSYDWTFSEKTKDEYDFYVTVVFDKQGKISVKDGYNVNESELVQRLSDFIVQYNESYWEGSYSINPIVDTTFNYAVPKELQAYDSIYWQQQMGYRHMFYENSGFPFVILGAAVIIMFIALLLSSKKICRVGTGITSKIPLEIIVAAGTLAFGLAISMSEIIYLTHTGKLAEYLISIGFPDKLIPFLHIGAWATIFGVVAIITLSIKQLFVKGFRRYCKENVLIIRIINWCLWKVKYFINKITEINVDDTVNKFLFKILALNFIILTIFCSIWFFGIAGLIVYTIAMFFFLQKKLQKIKDDYDSIMEITDSLAKGNLNVTEERDLGVFEPMKTNLTRIQGGFKKAVEEELKSQNMKTELITNVSHDLKTPLTAIITYVDLLKNEEITEEERKSYIDTLDKKSQRLKHLIEDLFEVSKANSGNMEVNLATVDVLSLIKQAELELSEKLEEVGIEVCIRSNEEKIYLELDGQKSYRIFENLFGNLVKYAMPNRKAYVDVISTGSVTQIEVKNMSKEELDFDTSEITERFVRGDKSRNSEGSGLGLAIVKSLVELQGGRFEIVIDGDLFKAIITFEN